MDTTTVTPPAAPVPATPVRAEPTPSPPAPTLRRILRAVGWLVAASAAGAALGAAARLWMRLLADDPAFSWSGTIAIVLVFAATGAGHAVATLARRARRRRWSTAGRLAGAVLTLGLFVAAGSIMFPTVVGGSLAVWRRDWRRWARVVAAAVAVPAPAAIVAEEIGAGPTPGRVAGVVLFAATYGAVVWALRPVVAPLAEQVEQRAPRTSSDGSSSSAGGAASARTRLVGRSCST